MVSDMGSQTSFLERSYIKNIGGNSRAQAIKDTKTSLIQPPSDGETSLKLPKRSVQLIEDVIDNGY